MIRAEVNNIYYSTFDVTMSAPAPAAPTVVPAPGDREVAPPAALFVAARDAPVAAGIAVPAQAPAPHPVAALPSSANAEVGIAPVCLSWFALNWFGARLRSPPPLVPPRTFPLVSHTRTHTHTQPVTRLRRCKL